MMKNYVEKYSPSGDFEKAKVRVLVRGDLQDTIGETQGPVSRVESIFVLISIAVLHNYEIFKIDITSAYLNTSMNDNVKHKWLMLDKDVALIGSHACLVLPVLAGCGLSRSHTQWLVAYPPSGLVAEAYGRVASPSRMHNSTNYNKWSG